MTEPETTAEARPAESTEETAAGPSSGDQATVAIDPEFAGDRAGSDNDSSLGDDDLSSYTTSLSSSIRQHIWEHGRRWHAYKAGRYVLPNDEEENDRLDIFHHMVGLVLGNKLHLSPIGDKPGRILDIGTGTGIWAIEAGDEYPSAQILGSDLSPIQPSMVPPNVKFEIDDVEADWTYNEPFDFIHGRYLSAAIEDWPKLMTQAYNHTKPGGWAEFQDFDYFYFSDDGSLTLDHALSKWIRLLQHASLDIRKRDCCPGPKLYNWMKDAGFVNLKQEVFRVPIGPWPANPELKRIGEWNRLQLMEGIEAFSIFLLVNIMGWSMEEMQVLIAQCRQDIMNRKIHSQMLLYVAYGQRPT